jgi:hypothetical protein
MADTYLKSSARKVRRIFWCKFQDVTVSHRETIKSINKFRQTGL